MSISFTVNAMNTQLFSMYNVYDVQHLGLAYEQAYLHLLAPNTKHRNSDLMINTNMAKNTKELC